MMPRGTTLSGMQSSICLRRDSTGMLQSGSQSICHTGFKVRHRRFDAWQYDLEIST